MGEPIAYFLTWTCHGTWLHGDGRGSVDGWHNRLGTPVYPADAARERIERSMMSGQVVRLDAEARRIVGDAIRNHCLHRGWELLAVNVRRNHVHIVLSASGEAIETVMGQLKAWGTRRLREAGAVAPGNAVWARHGSTRYLWKDVEVAAAVAYVNEAQDVPR